MCKNEVDYHSSTWSGRGFGGGILAAFLLEPSWRWPAMLTTTLCTCVASCVIGHVLPRRKEYSANRATALPCCLDIILLYQIILLVL